MLKLNFLRSAAINFLPLLFILFHIQTTSAQHPCDNFPVTTCTVPSALETWTITDDNTSATGQTGDDFTSQIGSHDPNLKTLWYRWNAPKTRVYVVDTKGTNPNETLNLDTVIKITIGGTTPANTTLFTYNQDWNGVSECLQYFSTLRGTEHIRSSCTILYAVAGTTYNFQIDAQNGFVFPQAGPFLLNLRPLIEPTSSNVSVSGRVLDSSGNPLERVSVKLTKPNGEVLRTNTNTFGFYGFTGIESGQSYVLQADSNRFTFQNNPRVLFVNNDLQDQNISATENPNS